jgi:L,D-peptidoglycan transpeptidase YkuD (ErfK/YbiS/YcfS/YnhG family)
MNFEVHADGVFFGPKITWRCALGRSGVAAMGAKREGDGATPAGLWPLRRLLYRPDRLGTPKTGLPVAALTPTDGWCDASGDPAYNQPVTLPYPASAEPLWREDGVYDIIVALGYNDAPVVPGRGSAIFLHIARPDYSPTEGCVALAQADLLAILETATPRDALRIHAAPSRAG